HEDSITTPTVIAGLIWLAKHQNPDGSWGARSFANQCKDTICSGAGDGDYDIGLSGLALLAFLGAGYTPSSRDTYEGCDFGEVVRKASLYLITIQDAQGVFGGVRPGKFMYNQAIATYAITDLYSQLKNTVSEVQFKEPAQRAIDYLVSVRTPGKAWRYQPNDDRDNDTSVTGWVAMALKSAEAAELNVPPRVFADIKTFYDSVTDPSYGRVGYTGLGTVALKGGEENLNPVFQPSLTAIGIMTRIFMVRLFEQSELQPTIVGSNSLRSNCHTIDHKASDATLKNGVQLILSSLPTWDTSRLGIIDYYYWFYGSYCLNQYDGPNGPAWKTWNERMKSVLISNQKGKTDGCASGSWDPIDRWGDEGGRVYATAINVLTLEVYYRLRIVIRDKDVAAVK
ncbi:MAG: terpene cyclase/mutase family protein, partial [Planctomycetes bacterium]|nr:terpene cyclase/mutase family protein [Planctomycetota bacterium]